LSQAHGVTPASFFHLAWAKVVAACSAKQDVVFGTVLSGRAQSASGPQGLLQTLGVFMNTLPIRINLTDQSVAQALKEAHRAVSELMPYEHASLALASRCSGVPADTPLFSALLNYRHSGVDEQNSALSTKDDNALFELNEWHERSNYPFSLAVDDFASLHSGKGGFGLEVQVNEPGLAKRVMGYVEQTLLSLVTALNDADQGANSLISQMTVLPQAERDQQQAWNQTTLNLASYFTVDSAANLTANFATHSAINLTANDASDLPSNLSPNLTLEALFSAQARKTPNAIAVQNNEQVLTYQRLDSLSDALAYQLQSLGVQKASHVVVCQSRSVYTLVSLLGVLKAGAAYVPVDPAYPQERVRFMLEDANAQWIVSDTALMQSPLFASDEQRDKKNKAACAPHVIDVQRMCESFSESDQSLIPQTVNRQTVNHQAADHQVLTYQAAGDSVAYMIYTSGSTGTPKAVQVTRRNMVNFLLGMQDLLQLQASDTLLAVTSLSFDIAVLELFLPLISGAKVVIGHETLAQNGPDMVQAINEHNVSIMQATPVSWKILLASGWQPTADFTVLCGGEAFPGDLAQSLLSCNREQGEKSAQHAAPNVWNLYGPTETTVWSSAYRLKPDLAHEYASVPIGFPIANMQIWVMDEALQPVPSGVIGELCIGGEGVTQGYLGQPALTASRYVNTELGRVYRTGDLARVDANGTLHCLGRMDHQVKIRGFRIELGEIEANLAQHAQIQEVVVHAHESRGEPVLVAYVVVHAQAQMQDQKALDIDAIHAFLQPRLPHYMIPSQVMLLDAMPLTPNGKVDRNALPTPFGNDADTRLTHAHTDGTTTRDAAPNTAQENAYQGPDSELEMQLQRIWQDLLGIDAISVHSNFFHLGGHSLLATRLMMRCQETFGVKLALEDMFQRQTIASMAELIAQSQASQGAHGEDGASALDDDALSRIDDLLAEFE